jgi:hypothetical protein
MLLLVVFSSLCIFYIAYAAPVLDINLPGVNPNLSPLAEDNRILLLKRFVVAFDHGYAAHLKKTENKNLAEGYTIYFLRQELQALLDMWRATGKLTYLEQAKTLVFKTITDTQLNQRQLLYDNQTRGNWPCFFSKDIEKATGGHGQLYDFQGSAGFMMVADALHQAKESGWKEIADFVEKISSKNGFFVTQISNSKI